MRGFVAACLVWLAMLSPALARNCVVPSIQTLDNQTVSGAIYVVSGKSCSIILARSPGPIQSVQLITPPASGKVSISGGRVIYTARPGFVGDDRFVYARRGLNPVNRPISRTVDVAVKVTSSL